MPEDRVGLPAPFQCHATFEGGRRKDEGVLSLMD